jgi:hypothetical protein
MHHDIDTAHATADKVGIQDRTNMGREGRPEQVEPCDFVLALSQSPD